MPDKPTANYERCPDCGHHNAEHCPIRGCRQIIKSGAKTHEPNTLCGCRP